MVTVRRYKDADYEQVRANLRQARLFDKTWDSRANLKKMIRKDQDSILVAIADGKVVSSVYVLANGWESYIYRLVVGKGFRDKGIGKLLMYRAFRRLKSKGVKEVALYVDQKYRGLVKFYTKLGFESSGLYRSMWKQL